MEPIYLDHNSTSPPFPETVAALETAYREPLGNPASQHRAGRRARQALEGARELIARFLGGKTATIHRDTLILTSGATEANNLVLFGLAGEAPGRVILSAVEHPSVREPALALGRRGWKVVVLGVDSAGRVDPTELETRLAEGPADWVSVMFGNHETGVVQPLGPLSQVAARYGVPMHCDATQAAGKVAVSRWRLGIAAMTISAHKFQGPVGVGGLLLAEGVVPRPRTFGGFQQGGVRPGTEAVPPVLGMLAALRKWDAERDVLAAELAAKRDRFEARLRESIPGVLVNGLDGPDGTSLGPIERLPQTSNLSFPRVDRQAFLMALDLAGIACSTGSACASGSPEPSPVLTAMGLPLERVRGALRFSFGPQTSPAEVDDAVERIVRVHRSLARP